LRSLVSPRGQGRACLEGAWWSAAEGERLMARARRWPHRGLRMAAAIQRTMAKAKMIFTDQKDEYEYWTVRQRQFVEVPVVSALYN